MICGEVFGEKQYTHCRFHLTAWI